MHGYDPLRDWADIRLFLAIFDKGSLVGAAELLGLTQPTVGRRLSAMETRFGTPLFVRAGRRMQLTDAGKAILDSARRMEIEMLAIERHLEAQSTALRGEVTISATEGTGTEWLTPVLRDFHREYPEIVLNVQIDSRAADLLHREADIALRLGQPEQQQLIARRLVTVGFGLYASQDYLDNAPPVHALEDLAEHQRVGLRTPGNREQLFESLPFSDPLPGNYTYVSNSPTAQMVAVKAGFGIGLLSHRWATMAGKLVRVMPQYNATSIDLWLVTHEELRYSARIRTTFDFIAERALADAELFARGDSGPARSSKPAAQAPARRKRST
ncbi:HTH-type transcriptional regulator DmlR [Halioglobus japonicus]|nr:HTH-type transcriptional regulator DmlR [Halioglobus japonicus]